MFNNQPIRPVPITGEAESNPDRNLNMKKGTIPAMKIAEGALRTTFPVSEIDKLANIHLTGIGSAANFLTTSKY